MKKFNAENRSTGINGYFDEAIISDRDLNMDRFFPVKLSNPFNGYGIKDRLESKQSLIKFSNGNPMIYASFDKVMDRIQALNYHYWNARAEMYLPKVSEEMLELTKQVLLVQQDSSPSVQVDFIGDKLERLKDLHQMKLNLVYSGLTCTT